MNDPADRWRVSPSIRQCLEIALTQLIWAEASNLRFCPEFLCYLHYMLATALGRHLRSLVKLPAGLGGAVGGGGLAAAADRGEAWGEGWTYLDNVVRPNYNRLVKDTRPTPGLDHVDKRNYDDFNEYFHDPDCLTPESRRMVIVGWIDDDDGTGGGQEPTADDGVGGPELHDKSFLEGRESFVPRRWILCVCHPFPPHSPVLSSAGQLVLSRSVLPRHCLSHHVSTADHRLPAPPPLAPISASLPAHPPPPPPPPPPLQVLCGLPLERWASRQRH